MPRTRLFARSYSLARKRGLVKRVDVQTQDALRTRFVENQCEVPSTGESRNRRLVGVSERSRESAIRAGTDC